MVACFVSIYYFTEEILRAPARESVHEEMKDVLVPSYTFFWSMAYNLLFFNQNVLTRRSITIWLDYVHINVYVDKMSQIQ